MQQLMIIDKYFKGTVSRIEGVSLKDIQEDVETLHSKAFDPLGLSTDTTLDSSGAHKMRSGKEEHLYNPQTIHLLQLATRTGDYKTFKEYTALVNKEEGVKNLRGLMNIKFPKKGISIDEVESVDSIVRRFKTGAMSYGSISREAHETMAIAMNMLHGKSNSGEGGEDIDRLKVGPDGLNRCSAIKQVASGRFGVTSRYLVSAQEIQIKMAQGAKPGEGGHLQLRVLRLFHHHHIMIYIQSRIWHSLYTTLRMLTRMQEYQSSLFQKLVLVQLHQVLPRRAHR